MHIEILDKHPVIQEVAKVLGNFDCYVVGGAVRNCLSNRPINDLDFATNANPDEIEILFRARGYKPILTGKAFGTIRVILNKETVEITTYRAKENYASHNRKPSVIFGKDIIEDLQRRDFTINALAYSPTHGLVDPFNAISDLKKEILRTPIDPDETFSQDPLRLLRAARFISVYGFIPHPNLWDATVRNAHRLLYLSAERLKMEMDKLLIGQYVGHALAYLIQTSLMNYMIPEIIPMLGMQQNQEYHHKDVWAHTQSVVEHLPANSTLRWAGLLHDIAKPQTYIVTKTGIHFYHHEDLGVLLVDGIAQRLRFSTEERIKVKQLVKYHMRPNLYKSNWNDAAVRRLKNECSSFLDDLMALSRADITSMKPERVKQALDLLDELNNRLNKTEIITECPIDGERIKKMGLPEGRLVGVVKAYLLKQIEKGVDPKDTQTLIALAVRKVKELKNGN